MKSTAIGSTVSLLLVFSAISYANGYVPHQDPKPVQQPTPAQQVQISNQQPGTCRRNRALNHRNPKHPDRLSRTQSAGRLR